MRGVELDLRNRLEESQRHINENQKRLQYWQDKLEKLTLHTLRFVALVECIYDGANISQ